MEIDKNSVTWLAVVEYANKRVNELTGSLIAENDERTRGAILELQDLINLTEKRVRPQVAAEDHYHG